MKLKDKVKKEMRRVLNFTFWPLLPAHTTPVDAWREEVAIGADDSTYSLAGTSRSPAPSSIGVSCTPSAESRDKSAPWARPKDAFPTGVSRPFSYSLLYRRHVK